MVGWHSIRIACAIDIYNVAIDHICCDWQGCCIACSIYKHRRSRQALGYLVCGCNRQVVATVVLGGERIAVVDVVENLVGLRPSVANPTCEKSYALLEEKFHAVRIALAENEIVVGVVGNVVTGQSTVHVFNLVFQRLVVNLD